MLEGQRIAVLVPAYNEERQIRGVIGRLPEFVDHAVVIDDASTDRTAEVVDDLVQSDPRVHLISLDSNRGVGGALSIGYRWARDNDVDIAVSMDGDGQMHPDDLMALLEPILTGDADYTKGNRLVNPESWKIIPPVRLFGNAVLSLLTKMSSGYWAVADSQSGFSAAGRYALHTVDWESMYPRYGRPNDVLVLANAAECRVADIPVRALYGVGERSTMRITKVTFSIAWLLFRRFWWRLWKKYILRDFHPLVFFYLLATVTGIASAALTVRLVALWIANGHVPQMTALAAAFFGITCLNSTFFGYWMDMQANEHLNVRLPPAGISAARAQIEGVAADGGGERPDRDTLRVADPT